MGQSAAGVVGPPPPGPDTSAGLAADALLAAWEAAASAAGHGRALALLAPLPAPRAAALPLGRRDALLLDLYRGVRGPWLDALAECPGCAATVEIRLSVAELVDGYPAAASGSEPLGDPGPRDLDLGTARVRARCPATADLVAAAAAGTADGARDVLVARCVELVSRPDGSARPLDDDELDRVGRHLERADPLVDVRLDIRCDECGHGWPAPLDVPALVWAQVRAGARRLLTEVDALARRYGWSQAEILGLSERRRRAYLDLT
ncbi:hypothetical protein I6A84_18635 [Frankia sp. CNm7]|uniref:hypothetical protein n=1 Tax=Frankia nepalensis TaxID=1836974 RepID=UPI0019314B5E|nr:hypothetical protein [Frankia nepalensis]MBL7520052.1 hypothetical protein [Frankia nepalensis]